MPKSRSEELFNHATKFATPFATPLGHAWAIVPSGNGRYRGWPLSSIRFREWLANGYFAEYGVYPGVHALDSAIRMLAAEARFGEFPTREVFARIGARGEPRDPLSILIHLANPANELLEITPEGHHIIAGESWHFVAGEATAALPQPAFAATPLPEQLEQALSITGPPLTRALVWLFAALRPEGPYPLLFITGPEASGKTVLARGLRALIDPSATPLLEMPETPAALFTQALHNHVLAFDDVLPFPRQMQAAISRLATGTGFGICHRNMFDEPDPVALARPIIMVAPRVPRAFAGKAMHLRLDTIATSSLRTEAQLARQLTAAAPCIFGSLVDAVSRAMAGKSVEAAPVSRFADVHQWTMAAAPALGLTANQVNYALAANPLVDALKTLVVQNKEWDGTATELLEALAVAGYPDLAAGARALSQQLTQTPLELFGIYMEKFSTGDERRIRLTQTPEISVSEGLS